MSRRDIVGGLIVAVVAGFILWAAGMIFPQSREWWGAKLASGGAHALDGLRWLWAGVPVPRVIVWGVIALAVVYGLRKLARAATDRATTLDLPPDLPLDLSDDEQRILRALAEADGREIWFTQVQELLQASRLRTEHAITMLRGRGLVKWYSDLTNNRGGSGSLTPQGRALCVAMRWTK